MVIAAVHDSSNEQAWTFVMFESLRQCANKWFAVPSSIQVQHAKWLSSFPSLIQVERKLGYS